MDLNTYIFEWNSNHSKRANFALIKNIANNNDWINNLKTFVNFKSDSIEQLLYHFINDKKDISKCINCNTDLKFVSLSLGYNLYCSKGCKTSYEHKLGKFKDGHEKGSIKFKATYGKNGIKHNELIRNREITCKERYGVSHPMKDPRIVSRVMETCIKRYNETNPMKVNYIKEKVKQTNIEAYGFSRPIQNLHIFETMFKKYKETLKNRYNVDCVFQVPEFFEKAQDTSFRRFQYEDLNLHFQASYEKHFLDYCKKLNVIDKITDGPFLWYVHDSKNKRYFSDFYYDELNLIIEIKSNHWYYMYKEQNDAKRDECISQGFNYIMILDKDYNAFNKIIK
jgi:hypothetical protein